MTLTEHRARIRSIYRAEVEIPEAVWERFGHTSDYDRFSCSFANLDGVRGSDTCSDVVEWQEGPDRRDAQVFVDRWRQQIRAWEQQLMSEAGQHE